VNVQEFAELAAGHALHALSPEDERAFQAALAEHPDWAVIVDADVATAAHLGDAVDAVAPPLALRGQLLSRISGGTGTDGLVEPLPLDDEPRRAAEPLAVDVEPRRAAEPPPSTEAVQTVARRNWTRGLLALAASFVLLIALGTTAVVIGDRLREPASISALNQIEDAEDSQAATAEVAGGGTATAHWSESLGKVVLVTDGVSKPESGKTYEMWFVRGDTPVAAGVFSPDRDGQATALLDEQMQPGDVIAVTVEDRGGSKTGQPTTDPIVTIPTA
jgi:anti-sigma-K factor RskA